MKRKLDKLDDRIELRATREDVTERFFMKNKLDKIELAAKADKDVCKREFNKINDILSNYGQ